jgi:hypothetical protein
MRMAERESEEREQKGRQVAHMVSNDHIFLKAARKRVEDKSL